MISTALAAGIAVLFFGFGVGCGFVLLALVSREKPATPARRWKDYEAARRDDSHDIEHQTSGAPGRPRDYAHRYDGLDDQDILN